jgi:hypothetical protein
MRSDGRSRKMLKDEFHFYLSSQDHQPVAIGISPNMDSTQPFHHSTMLKELD